MKRYTKHNAAQMMKESLTGEFVLYSDVLEMMNGFVQKKMAEVEEAHKRQLEKGDGLSSFELHQELTGPKIITELN